MWWMYRRGRTVGLQDEDRAGTTLQRQQLWVSCCFVGGGEHAAPGAVSSEQRPSGGYEPRGAASRAGRGLRSKFPSHLSEHDQ